MSDDDLVLLVEPEPALRDQLLAALREMGFAVEVAIDAIDAMARLQQGTPRLICVDLSLPRGSGYDVIDQVRADRDLADVPIIVFSDRHTPEDMAFAEEAGANAFIPLPLRIERLDRYVSALLSGQQPSFRAVRWLKPSEFPPRQSARRRRPAT